MMRSFGRLYLMTSLMTYRRLNPACNPKLTGCIFSESASILLSTPNATLLPPTKIRRGDSVVRKRFSFSVYVFR